MREAPAILRTRSAMGAPPRTVLARPERPRRGVAAFLAAIVLALVTGVPLRSAHLLLPRPED